MTRTIANRNQPGLGVTRLSNPGRSGQNSQSRDPQSRVVSLDVKRALPKLFTAQLHLAEARAAACIAIVQSLDPRLQAGVPYIRTGLLTAAPVLWCSVSRQQLQWGRQTHTQASAFLCCLHPQELRWVETLPQQPSSSLRGTLRLPAVSEPATQQSVSLVAFFEHYTLKPSSDLHLVQTPACTQTQHECGDLKLVGGSASEIRDRLHLVLRCPSRHGTCPPCLSRVLAAPTALCIHCASIPHTACLHPSLPTPPAAHRSATAPGTYPYRPSGSSG